jgi:hypothetical protein
MKITPAASSAARIAARLSQSRASILEVDNGISRDNGSARQFGLIHLDQGAGGAAWF